MRPPARRPGAAVGAHPAGEPEPRPTTASSAAWTPLLVRPALRGLPAAGRRHGRADGGLHHHPVRRGVRRAGVHPGRRRPGRGDRRGRRAGPGPARPRRRPAGAQHRARDPAARPGHPRRGAAQGAAPAPARPAARRRAGLLRRLPAAGPRARRQPRRAGGRGRGPRPTCPTTSRRPTSRRTTCRATASAPPAWRAWRPVCRWSPPCARTTSPGCTWSAGGTSCWSPRPTPPRSARASPTCWLPGSAGAGRRRRAAAGAGAVLDRRGAAPAPGGPGPDGRPLSRVRRRPRQTVAPRAASRTASTTRWLGRMPARSTSASAVAGGQRHEAVQLGGQRLAAGHQLRDLDDRLLPCTTCRPRAGSSCTCW